MQIKTRENACLWLSAKKTKKEKARMCVKEIIQLTFISHSPADSSSPLVGYDYMADMVHILFIIIVSSKNATNLNLGFCLIGTSSIKYINKIRRDENWCINILCRSNINTQCSLNIAVALLTSAMSWPTSSSFQWLWLWWFLWWNSASFRVCSIIKLWWFPPSGVEIILKIAGYGMDPIGVLRSPLGSIP